MNKSKHFRKSFYVSQKYEKIVEEFTKKYGNNKFSKQICRLIKDFMEDELYEDEK